MAGFTNFITIKDFTSTSPLWNGEEVIILGEDLKIEGSNNISVETKNFQDVSLATSPTTETWPQNFNRRKAQVNYGGFTNHLISFKITYNPNNLSHTLTISGSSKKIFTPSKLMELVMKPRTVYIKDEFVIRSLLSATEDTSPAIYSANGMPVVLADWSISPSDEGTEVVMDISFREDKELA